MLKQKINPGVREFRVQGFGVRVLTWGLGYQLLGCLVFFELVRLRKLDKASG